MAVRVVLDSNFLFVPLQFQIDIFEEIERLVGGKVEFIVLSSTIEELKKLMKGGDKLSRQASFALKLTEKCKVLEVEHLPGESNDEIIVRFAKKFKCAVATNDRTLKRTLRNMGIAVIYVREKTRLEMEGALNNV